MIRKPSKQEIARAQSPTTAPTGPLARVTILGLALIASATVQAAIFSVSNQNNSGSGSLRAAVSAANLSPGPDTIIFDPSITSITLSTGQIDVTEALVIDGQTTQPVISGNDTSRIFAGLVVEVIEIRNLVLTDGATSAAGTEPDTCASGTGEGGAVCTLGQLRLENVSVTDSTTSGDDAPGGAVYSDDHIFCDSCRLAGNGTDGTDSGGGALFASGNFLGSACTVENNATGANSSPGGGLTAGRITLNDCLIQGNTTAGSNAFGGGLANMAFGPDIRRSIVTYNHTTGLGSAGGGLFITTTSAATGTLLDSIISNNSTSGLAGWGGGAYLDILEMQIQRSTIANNFVSGSSAWGAGLASEGGLEIVTSTVSGNDSIGDAASGAGGVYFDPQDALAHTLSIGNSTITDNQASNGVGGLFARAADPVATSVSVNSSILAGNSGADGNYLGEVGTGNGVTLNALHVVFGDAGTEINGSNLANILSDLPELGPLQDNGCASASEAGPPGQKACTPSQRPLDSSSAIDAGDNPSSLDYDQRGPGFPRVSGPTTDIGALERIFDLLFSDSFEVGKAP